MVIKGIKARVLARIGQERKNIERYKHLIKRYSQSADLQVRSRFRSS